jgi:hypothetical protein
MTGKEICYQLAVLISLSVTCCLLLHCWRRRSVVDVPGMSPGKRASLTASARNITSYRHLSSASFLQLPNLASLHFPGFAIPQELFWPPT